MSKEIKKDTSSFEDKCQTLYDGANHKNMYSPFGKIYQLMVEEERVNDIPNILQTLISRESLETKAEIIIDLYELYVRQLGKSWIHIWAGVSKITFSSQRGIYYFIVFDICGLSVDEINSLEQKPQFSDKMSRLEKSQLRDLAGSLLNKVQTGSSEKDALLNFSKLLDLVGDSNGSQPIPIKALQDYFHGHLSPLINGFADLLEIISKEILFRLEVASCNYRVNASGNVERDVDYIIPFVIKATQPFEAKEGDNIQHMVEISGLGSYLTNVYNHEMQNPQLTSIVTRHVTNWFVKHLAEFNETELAEK